MKRILAIVLFSLIHYFVFSQSIKGGLIAGFNATQVDGDEVYGFRKYGLNAGACAIVPLWNNFSFTIETLYNQKGSYQRPQYADTLSGEYKLILKYLDVPVLIHYNDKDIIKF